VRVLITGITGLLGMALQNSPPKAAELFGVYFPERALPAAPAAEVRAADVTDRLQMQAVFKWTRPDVVIHTAAIGSVDFAEKNRDQTRAINVDGTQVVADLCREARVHLVYISSNAVFNGRAPLYAENAPVSPLNYYGQLKVEAENVVQASGVPWTIVRPILMYGWPYPGERENPAAAWVRALEAGQPIQVVDNVFSKPLPAWSCAEAVWAALEQRRQGVYHAAGRDHVSLHEFALRTAEVFGVKASLITAVPDSHFPEIAPRPKDTSFDTTKMEIELGVKPVGIREGLARMKAERPARA
jgi:dTDP-4-dehydrorhamnose reductase